MSAGRLPTAALASLVWLLLGAGVLHLLGVAGFRGGFVVAATVLGGGAAAIAVAMLRRTDTPLAAWALTAAVLGAVLAGGLVEVAPPSHGVLAARLDALDLPGHQLVEERRSGSGWCRPRCPTVTRVYAGAAVRPRAAVLEVTVALLRNGYLTQDELPARPGPALRLVTDDMRLDVRAEGPRRRHGRVRTFVHVVAAGRR